MLSYNKVLKYYLVSLKRLEEFEHDRRVVLIFTSILSNHLNQFFFANCSELLGIILVK